MSESRDLTRRQFDAVIRRAAQLAASDSGEGEEELTEVELFRIAREVGLPESHVRRALIEVRSGGSGGGVVDRVFGPSRVQASRVVPGESVRVADRLDEFLVATQLLQPVRRGPRELQYRPALDWASKLARAASFQTRKYYIASARSVSIHLDEADDGRTRVDLIVDPGTRGDDLAAAVVGTALGGGGVGALAAWGLATLVPLGLAVGAGLLCAAGVGGGITYAVGQTHKRKLREVHLEMEGVLDTLEMGASLEPPPASWRRWVKRHFHGVARDLMRVEEDREI